MKESNNRQQVAARKATEVPRPQQPTAQERAEHELTHLPYRSWCDICVRTNGKTNSHPRQKSSQPVTQVDMTYIKSLDDKSTTPILTAIDVETGMSMATLIQDRTQHFEYLVNCMCNFLMESGRAKAILANTVLQSDQEQFLINLLKATALRLGNNISVRQSAAYNSQSQGSVERFHRTLISQIRSLRAQVKQYYDRDINCEQPLMPWLVRRSNYLLNRYLIHNDGNTSFYRRWGKEHKTPICIFAETVQYMAQTAKTMPKLEQRFFKSKAAGLARTATNEHIIGIANRVVRAQTIRRMVRPDNFDKQLLDIINSYPWTPISTAPTGVMPLAISAPKPSATAETQTVDAQPLITSKHTSEQQESEENKRRRVITDVPLATSPTSQQKRQALPMPTLGDGSPIRRSLEAPTTTSATKHEPKQVRTTLEISGSATGRTEQAATRLRISALQVTTKKGETITATANEDDEEATTERILLEPIIHDTEGFDKQKLITGMKKEIDAMKQQPVFTERHMDELTPEEQQTIIQSKWVHREKGDDVRCRIVAKGFTEHVNDADDIYASTPVFAVLRWLLALALTFRWSVTTGDISTAFLHAEQGPLWAQIITKGLAGSSRRHPSTCVEAGAPQNRTKRLQDTRQHLLNNNILDGLCRRPFLPGSTRDHQ